MNIFYHGLEELTEIIEAYPPKGVHDWVAIVSGFSIATQQTMLEMIGHILHSAIGDKPYNPSEKYHAKYALKSGVELAAIAHDGVTQSRAQFKRIRDGLAAFGCFVVPDREFIRYTAEEAAERRAEGDKRVRAGQMKRGANMGKKHAGEIFDIDVDRMLDIASAIVQIFKGQETDDDGIDGWTAYKPVHGCSWLAKLWKRVKGFGTLFTPDKHEGDRPFFDQKPRNQVADAAAIENEIYQWWDWHNYRATKGEQPSIFAWRQLNRLKRSLARATEWMRPPDDDPAIAD